MVEDKIRKAAALRPALPKRFYKVVSVSETPDGYAVLLDGRAIKTPKRRTLSVPTAALAEAVAAEWEAQGETIDPHTMPMTQLANTVIDGIVETQAAVAESFVTFARADLLCYRVAYPESLARAQAETWQPVLDWAEAAFGARFRVTTEIQPIDQPDETLAAIRAVCAAYDPWRLAALHALAGVYGSAVLALAVLEGHIAADRASLAARVDETHQAERWGEDAEARRRADALAAEAAAAARFAELVRRAV